MYIIYKRYSIPFMSKKKEMYLSKYSSYQSFCFYFIIGNNIIFLIRVQFTYEKHSTLLLINNIRKC